MFKHAQVKAVFVVHTKVETQRMSEHEHYIDTRHSS